VYCTAGLYISDVNKATSPKEKAYPIPGQGQGRTITSLSWLRSFVRYCGLGTSLLWTPALSLRPYVGPSAILDFLNLEILTAHTS